MSNQASIHIKLLPGLRARASACAALEGLSLPEFVRASIRAHCEESEKRHGQRTRTARAAADLDAADGGGP